MKAEVQEFVKAVRSTASVHSYDDRKRRLLSRYDWGTSRELLSTFVEEARGWHRAEKSLAMHKDTLIRFMEEFNVSPLVMVPAYLRPYAEPLPEWGICVSEQGVALRNLVNNPPSERIFEQRALVTGFIIGEATQGYVYRRELDRYTPVLTFNNTDEVLVAYVASLWRTTVPNPERGKIRWRPRYKTTTEGYKAVVLYRFYYEPLFRLPYLAESRRVKEAKHIIKAGPRPSQGAVFRFRSIIRSVKTKVTVRK